jgi:hypothetical protein
MPSSGMLCHVTLERTDVSEERIASIIRVTRILFLCSVLRWLVTANFVLTSPILAPLMVKRMSSPDTSVLTRATRRHIAEDGILHSQQRENLKSHTEGRIFPCSALITRYAVNTYGQWSHCSFLIWALEKVNDQRHAPSLSLRQLIFQC